MTPLRLFIQTWAHFWETLLPPWALTIGLLSMMLLSSPI
jgi:hypothetical protein